MFDLLTNILPIGLGFVAKLVAIKSKAADDNQKMMIQQLNANAASTNSAREFSKGESRMAAFNRRMVLLIILLMVVFLQISPVLFDIPTVIEVTEKGLSLFGIIPLTADKTTFQSVDGVIAYSELFEWTTLVVSFYFGSSLAQTR